MKRFILIIVGLIIMIAVIGFMTIHYYDSKDIDYNPKITRTLVDSLVSKCSNDSVNDPTRIVFQNLINDYKFPDKFVDRIIVQRIYNPIDMFFPKVLSHTQTLSFISFLNDSTNFNWYETTFDKVDYVVQLFNNDKLVAKLWIGLDCKMIDCFPINPRMKFGMLNETSMNKLMRIIK